MHDPQKSAEPRKYSTAIIGIVIALLTQFGSIIWFAATLSGRIDQIEASQKLYEERYNREVIPRVDLTERLDRIDRGLDQIMDRLITAPHAGHPAEIEH